MMFLGKILFAGILFLGLPVILSGQYLPDSDVNTTTLPEVFILGEFEEAYEKLTPEYEPLIKACENDIKTAFEKWLSRVCQ